MRIISLEAISRNYTPIILRLQKVDEQVRTDSGVKAGVFLLTIRKFNTYFCVEVLRMVLALLKALVLQNSQLNFCNAQDAIACTKALITSARNNAIFDSAWSGILSVTEANDIIDDAKLSRPRKVPRRLDESSNAFFHAEAKDNYKQLYYEVLDSLSSYERALHLPTPFSISGLARLGVKPILCRSSSRAFSSTHPLMLPSTSAREALLACPPSPPWNLPSFTMEFTLSSSCSCSDFPLSRQGVALAHLDSLLPHDLLLWTTALFFFLLAKAAPAWLPTALSVALRQLIAF